MHGTARSSNAGGSKNGMCMLSTKCAMKLTALQTLWHACTTRAARPSAPSMKKGAPGTTPRARHRHAGGCLCGCGCHWLLWHTVHAKSYPSCTRRVTGLTGCGSIIRSTTPSKTKGTIDIQGTSNASNSVQSIPPKIFKPPQLSSTS